MQNKEHYTPEHTFFSKLKHPSRFSKPQLAVFVLAFALIGYLLVKAFAAAPLVASVEGENMLTQTASTTTSSTTTPVNLALNKPATASSTQTLHNGTVLKPSNAFDGNSSTRWSSNYSDPQWLQVDLGSDQTFNQVVLQWETAYGKSFQIQTSGDGSTWTTVYSTTSGTGGTQTLNVSGSGRYVRMYGTQRGTQYGYSLYEMKVMGSTTTSTTTSRVVSDSSASNGKEMELLANNTLTSSFNLPSTASSMTVFAKADLCSGVGAAMTLSVDGSQLINTTVNATALAAYNATVNLAAGTHTLNISYTNEVLTSTCDRNLYIDVSDFYGPTPVTSPPTVALSASPTAVTAGQSSTLTWTSTNATSCTASGAWSGTKTTSGSTSTGALNQTSTYSLTCTGTGGSATASASVIVNTATTGASIYWGAYLDNSANVHAYGSTDLKGLAWKDGPFSYNLSGNSWDTFEAHAGGKKVSLMHYGTPAPTKATFDTNTLNHVLSRGAIPVVDINTALNASGGSTITNQAIANGTYDSVYKNWFTAAKNNGKSFFFIPDVEMNGQWEAYSPYKNGNTAASFVAMWRHLHDLANGVGATNITWVWCPNIHPDLSYNGIYEPLSALYPGNSYVDWVGMDGFNSGGSNTFDYLFSSTLSAINNLTGSSKPFMLSQFGANPSALPSKAAWITDAFNQIKSSKYSQIKAVLWFNWWHSNGGKDDRDIESPYNGTLPIPVSQWSSNANMPAAQAFATSISSSYFNPKLTTMPPFGKIAAP